MFRRDGLRLGPRARFVLDAGNRAGSSFWPQWLELVGWGGGEKPCLRCRPPRNGLQPKHAMCTIGSTPL